MFSHFSLPFNQVEPLKWISGKQWPWPTTTALIMTHLAKNKTLEIQSDVFFACQLFDQQCAIAGGGETEPNHYFLGKFEGESSFSHRALPRGEEEQQKRERQHSHQTEVKRLTLRPPNWIRLRLQSNTKQSQREASSLRKKREHAAETSMPIH